MSKLTIANCEMDYCNDCIHGGEPAGCNSPDGICDGYNLVVELADEIRMYRSIGTYEECAAAMEFQKSVVRCFECASLENNARIFSDNPTLDNSSWCHEHDRDIISWYGFCSHGEQRDKE